MEFCGYRSGENLGGFGGVWWFDWQCPPKTHKFEQLVVKEWLYLKGLGDVVLLEEVCHWGCDLKFENNP